MADVFLARDLLLDRPVAIKVLFPEFAVDPSFVERFRREAQSAANLNHPNIVSVYDWGKYDDHVLHGDGVRRRDAPWPTSCAETATSAPCRRRRSPAQVSGRAGLRPPQRRSSTATSSRRTSSSARSGEVKVADFGIARAMNRRRRRTSPRSAP